MHKANRNAWILQIAIAAALLLVCAGMAAAYLVCAGIIGR